MRGSFHSETILESIARWQRSDGELEDIELVFCCLLKCDLGRCSTVVAVSGSGYVTDTPWEAREEGESSHTELFQALSFIPPLSAFTIPSRCPGHVVDPLRLSFSLFLNVQGAAANAIRIALEEMMTALGVAQTGSLYQRIEALPTQYREYKTALTSMRLLGNAGSHTLDRVTATDIEQAYTIIEFVLQKIYDGSIESISQLVARLDERFRPESRSA